MRYKNEMKLGDAIRAYLKALGFDKKLKERELINSWEEIMGKSVSDATDRLSIYNEVLFIYLNSSIVRHELQMMKGALIEALNKKVGERIIKNIVLK